MNILLLGASGHAKVIIDVVERAGTHHIVGLLDQDPPTERVCCGYPILGRVLDLAAICSEHQVGGVIGAIGDNWTRSKVLCCAPRPGDHLEFATAIHPSAQISRDVEIGHGTVIMAGAVINVGTRVGRHCIINTRSSVDHDAVIGDFVSIAPGATLGGNVRVGDFSAVSLGANIIHGVSIGEHTVVGAGAVVIRDVPSRVVAYGVPARVIRPRQDGQRYL